MTTKTWGEVVKMSLELVAVKLQQLGWRREGGEKITLYQTVMTARQLLDEKIVKIDRWSPENPEGYQRPLSRYRGSQISYYLTNEEGLFPTSILLNVRGNIEFVPLSEGSNIGKLVIPEKSLPLYLVDGQHRLYGLQYTIGYKRLEEYLEYELPVTIMRLDKIAEVGMFYKINKRQKGVPVDIAERNIAELLKTQKPIIERIEGPKKVLEAGAVDIVDYLDKQPDSPWYNKIQLPGEGRRDKLIKQSIMAKAIGKMFGMHQTLLTEDRDRVKEFLKNYWIAISKLFPGAFGNNVEYNLTRSQGVRAFTYLAGHVYLKCRDERNFTVEKILSILEKLKTGPEPIDDSWWHRDHGADVTFGTNERAVEALYRELLERIGE